MKTETKKINAWQVLFRIEAGEQRALYSKQQLHNSLQVWARLFMHVFKLLALNGGEKRTIRYNLRKNSLVTPGGRGELRGYNHTFNQSDMMQGIFFIGEDTSEYRIATVGRDKPSNSLFIIPVDLTTGIYRIQVRARIGEVLSLAILKPP